MIGLSGSMKSGVMTTSSGVSLVSAVQHPDSGIWTSPLKHGRLAVRKKYQPVPPQLVCGAYKAPVCLFGFMKQPKLPEVVQAGDPVLHEPAREVLEDEVSTQRVQETIDNMVAVMRQASAVGLAAPQIGVPLQVHGLRPAGYLACD